MPLQYSFQKIILVSKNFLSLMTKSRNTGSMEIFANLNKYTKREKKVQSFLKRLFVEVEGPFTISPPLKEVFEHSAFFQVEGPFIVLGVYLRNSV